MVKEVVSESEFNSTIANKTLTVVDFHATWCGPCKVVAPVFEQLSVKYPQATFIKVDVDQLQGVAAQCGVQAMPTFQLFKASQRLVSIRGGDMQKLESEIMAHITESFDAFSGSGRTLGGSGSGRPTPVNPWAEQREKHMKQRMQQSAATTGSTAAADEDEELKRAMELSKKEAAGGDTEGAPSSSSTQQQQQQQQQHGTPEAVMKAIEKSVNQEMLQELLGMDFPKVRALKALINTGSASVQQAVDWIFEHQDDADIDAPIEYSVETDEQRAERIQKGKERARELQEVLRAKKRAEEKERERERELKRRIQGKETREAAERFKELQKQREIEAEKERKAKERREKRHMKQLLLEDKARRKADRMAAEKDVVGLKELAKSFPDIAQKPLLDLGVTEEIPSGQPVSQQQQQQVMPQRQSSQLASQSTDCTIQLRLLDGKAERVVFKPQDTLSVVYAHAQRLQDGRRFELMAPFPRRTFTDAEMRQTLEDLKLAPRAQLICTPR